MPRKKKVKPLPPHPIIELLQEHYAQYLAERPAGAMTARELMTATGKTPAQIKAFLQAEKQAGNIESGRVIRARGGGVDTVYWRAK